MNINKIQSVSVYSNKNNKQNPNSISFKGARTEVLKYALNINKTYEPNMFTTQVAAFLDMPKREIIPFTEKLKKHKMNLLYKLSDKFNRDTYFNANLNTEKNKNLVFDIYNKIKYPQDTHTKLIDSTNYSFEQLNKIFDITEKDPKKLKLADNLLSTYTSTSPISDLKFNTLEEFLTTPSASKISSQYDDFKPYIELNASNKDIVKNLEAEIQKGYNKNTYIQKLNIEKLTSQQNLCRIINPDLIEANYKQEGVDLLKNLNKAYAGESDIEYSAKESAASAIMDIYNSTTKENFKTRSSILKFIQTRFEINKKLENAPLETVNKIFQKIDSDKEAQKFVDATVNKKTLFESISQIEDTLSNANLKKLNKRLDLTEYALIKRENLAEFSQKDFKTVDKQIKIAQKEEKMQMDRLFYSPNPIITDLHILKMKINGFIDKIVNKSN